MPRDRAAQYREKQQLVALFRAQLEVMRLAVPVADSVLQSSLAGWLDYYDELLAKGPNHRWPKAVLPGLRQGVRDFRRMVADLPIPQRREAEVKLRELAGDAAELLDAEDARRLGVIRRRGRVRNEDEYDLVRAAVDRLEGDVVADQDLLGELYRLVDEASYKGV